MALCMRGYGAHACRVLGVLWTVVRRQARILDLFSKTRDPVELVSFFFRTTMILRFCHPETFARYSSRSRVHKYVGKTRKRVISR